MLKLAFFGSDYFSINCLKQILPLYNSTNPTTSLISHLDIITRSPKLSGRGMKQFKDVPIVLFANNESLNLLRADKKIDFQNLLDKNNYDICIAVSYGKLIPSSFLKSLKFGGLNVHPSILPKYSGPAPLQRALLNNDLETGVTVQTLHPTEFDKGDILLQQKYNIKLNETIESLNHELSTIGGQLLKRVLEEKIYDLKSPTHQLINPYLPYSYAHKVHSNERQIDWDNFTSFDLHRRENTLGQLYTFKCFIPKKKSKSNTSPYKRIVLSNSSSIITPLTNDEINLPNGTFRLFNDDQFQVKVKDGWVTYSEIKTEGFGSENGSKFFSSLKKKFGTTDTTFITIPENNNSCK
ncbi:Methionyl-tRNA formyltransferase [Pichia californica]|uniref:methionyl-tRNA formyltransferase n=1 Tax=Pichia californica TaxID=460514 RepID=A0A9P6WPN2_9ASCO|nr:Methionyl-tRNA formyltransferase [[Candida] californica]KAG0691005.1 Methionyl-tRNA formyltransferase [[Candida] californica]